MTSKLSWAIGAVIFTLINLATLASNLSITARAEVAGKSADELERDDDFRQAVRYIARHVIEDCKVDGDHIKC
jgi:hypothetical protein